MNFKYRVNSRVRNNWQLPQIEQGFYSKKFRERLIEQDALSNEEAGFMHGYENLEDFSNVR